MQPLVQSSNIHQYYKSYGRSLRSNSKLPNNKKRCKHDKATSALEFDILHWSIENKHFIFTQAQDSLVIHLLFVLVKF